MDKVTQFQGTCTFTTKVQKTNHIVIKTAKKYTVYSISVYATASTK